MRAQNLEKIKKNKKLFHILSYNLHKTKVEVFLYNKIREERVDTIKKTIPYIIELFLVQGFPFLKTSKIGGFWNPKN